jgi:hypothetical protein
MRTLLIATAIDFATFRNEPETVDQPKPLESVRTCGLFRASTAPFSFEILAATLPL